MNGMRVKGLTGTGYIYNTHPFVMLFLYYNTTHVFVLYPPKIYVYASILNAIKAITFFNGLTPFKTTHSLMHFK